MAGITLADAQANLAYWLAAETSLAGGADELVEYAGRKVQKRSYTADEVTKKILFWDSMVKRLSSTRGRTRYLVPE